MKQISWQDFEKVEIRVGKIIKIEHLENAKYTTHKLIIDFGPNIGQKQSCARVINYSDKQLIDKLVIGVLNFPDKQIGQHISELLTLGLPDAEGECVLVGPDKDVPLGGKLY